MRKPISIPVGIWAYTGQTIIPHQTEILIIVSYTSVTRQLTVGRGLYNSSPPYILTPASLVHPFPTRLRLPLNILNNSFFTVAQPPLVQPSSSSSYESTTET